MRRSRTIREYRDKLRRNRAVGATDRKQMTTQKLVKDKKKSRVARERIAEIKAERRKLKAAKTEKVQKTDFSKLPAYQPFDMGEFVPYHEYKCTLLPVKVLHVIESTGLGGAQTMMMELVNGLNKYFGSHVKNFVLNLTNKVQKLSNKKLFRSYGVIPRPINHSQLKPFCQENGIQIVVQHRIANSQCIKKHLSDNVKYVLINHTWNSMHRISDFHHCDLYISVCKFLENRHNWAPFVHSTRHLVILNGVENDYIEKLPTDALKGKFKTGRCHRLVPSKFSIDSLQWMNRKVSKAIPGFTHYLMGTHGVAKDSAKNTNVVKYLGTILDRDKKISIIKGLDLYYYETFQHEGASVAILESLACGVPVLCKPFGGNVELVKNGVNGFILGDRSDFLLKMKQLSDDKSLLNALKQSTKMDFETRLHIKNTACQYMQVFDHLVNK